MKHKIASMLMVIALLLISGISCLAATNAENDKLLCAITEVVECDGLGECAQLTAEDVGLPDFLLIDLKEQKVMEANTASLRETRFNVNDSVEGMTILSGVDGRRGWSAVISDNNTNLTASVSDELVAFVLFGVCRADAR